MQETPDVVETNQNPSIATIEKGIEKEVLQVPRASEFVNINVPKVEVPFVAKDTDAPTNTTPSYPVKPEEKGMYHVRLDKKAFDQKTGKKLSKDFVQIFEKNEWKSMEAELLRQGYDIEILHTPA